MKLIFAFLFVVSCTAVNAQSISRFVVSPFGGSSATTTHYSANSVGEPGIGTYEGQVLVQSGFIQPDNWAFVAVPEESKIEISVYPNPVQNTLYLDLSGFNAEKIELYDATGKLVYTSTTLLAGVQRIDMSAYSRGLYFVRIQGGDALLKDYKILKQ